MFLGVVACPQEQHKFDGRIMLERVSRQRKLTQSSRNQNFSDDVLVNEAIKKGEWRDELFVYGMTFGELKERLVERYALDNYVVERLEALYLKWTARGIKKCKPIGDSEELSGTTRDENGLERPLSIQDIQLFVKMVKGDVVEEDVSCDSRFMLDIVPRVAEEMRKKFHWIPEEQKLYLVMDNAGGHGTAEAIQEYVNVLRTRNIEVIWQIPRSPETNMLDLGVWMSIQSAVCKAHFMKRCNGEALARSVMDAWETYLSVQAFKNVHGRLKVVLVCIRDAEGGNELVETKRGKLF